jgi:hypothetical protein
LLTTTWRPLLTVQLWWVVPLLVVSFAGSLATPQTTVDTSTDAGEIFGALAIALPALLITVLLTLTAQLASLHVLVQRATGRQVSVRAAMLAGLRRVHAMIGWGILAGLLVLVGVVLCVVPGIYVGLVMVVLPAIVLLERGRGIGRAFELFHAKFGESLARVATIAGIYLVGGIVQSAISGLLIGDLDPNADPDATPSIATALFGSIVSTSFSVALIVILAPLILTAYADMRARREPFSTAYLMPAPAPDGSGGA